MARLYQAFGICVLATVFAMLATTGTSFAAQIGKDATQISPLKTPDKDGEKFFNGVCYEIGVPCGFQFDFNCCQDLDCYSWLGTSKFMCLPDACFDPDKRNSTVFKKAKASTALA